MKVPNPDVEVGSRSNLSVLMSPEDVSAYLGVPEGTLANWRYQGRGPAFLRVGRHVRYRAEDVAEWIGALAGDGVHSSLRMAVRSTAPNRRLRLSSS